jgi:hypothetical protein
MVESIESTNRALLKVLIIRATIENAIILARMDLFHLQSQRADNLFGLINNLRDGVALWKHVLKEC